MLEISIILGLAVLLAWPLGHYMTSVYSARPHWGDVVFSPVERVIYKVTGINPDQGMGWKAYAKSLVLFNLVLGVIAFAVLKFQHLLPMNPDNIGPLSWDLALHTAVSFLTNTNQQHYSGQAQLTYLSQGVLIVTLQFLTPAIGLAACVAILRGMVGGLNSETAKEGEARNLGNFYTDVIRGTLRVLIPLALLLALLLTSQGVPSTFSGAAMATPVDAQAGLEVQEIPRGPVSAMVAIKQLGTNGGGFFGPNSSNPYENPTPISNMLQTISLILVPIAIVFMAGRLIGRKSLSTLAFTVMATFSVTMVAASVYSERQENAALAGLSAAGPNMEGKEVRFGTDPSALWATLTTQTSNGSVNSMHDSLNPMAGLVTRAGMLINSTWGGIGSGFINFIVYLWIAIFIAGLMIGRTPELFGRKVETKEIKALGMLIVLPAMVILGLTAITVAFPALTGNSNPGFHAVSQVFYEYTSAFANNGSGFEGLNDDSPWWNVTAVVALILGRYLPILLPLAIAGWMASKRETKAKENAIKLSGATFCVTVIAVILIINFLSFLPSAVIGPIGEGLEIASGNAFVE
ncbi:potassium-transporting ATPase subunit KdpA [Aliidiomarina iranensis]|uniref:Potassium-transporting ATPase potassium-binding subunit n=1 Tax=Aliidiomarina iranensis TaxID=1434071 RepID=A0A432W268_9GAMM|nr:potassium-transporting ATPase subunit KdpA [Aliidiomarina iranensis]RUO23311.1 potassium-transporting ATPase subunit KdpA [Aliidiomarina iranensis]